jgi:ribosomal protein L5
MISSNKKSLYTSNICYDMAMRLNCKNIVDIPTISKIDVNISDPSVALNKRNILPILTALELITKQK